MKPDLLAAKRVRTAVLFIVSTLLVAFTLNASGQDLSRRQMSRLLSEMALAAEAKSNLTALSNSICSLRRQLEGQEPNGSLSSKEVANLRRGAIVLEQLVSAPEAAFGAEGHPVISEVLASMRNLLEPPVAPQYDFFEVPFAFAARLNCRVGPGDSEATNVDLGAEQGGSSADPPSSDFWHKRASIPELDLFHGFGRTRTETFASTIWNYAGPKTGSGMNPGFDLKSGGIKLRVKFAETRSEPFAARIFWALGYNVEPTDYCAGLKIRYDRRLFQEFNSRKDVGTHFRFAGIVPLYTLNLQKHYDPFACIDRAIMKDGRQISGSALKHELLIDPARFTVNTARNFRSDIEEQIDYLVTVPANVQVRDKTVRSIGPWHFHGLGHEDRRELRGMGLLAAWIGWFDCRPENTRLKVVRQSGCAKLLFYLSDLGGGLGKADGVFSGKGERPDDFPWTFTQPAKFQGPGHMTIPFRVTGYRPIEHNEAFERMTQSDARWMARLIAQLTEQQMIDALTASGFNSAEVRLYTAKLISRRDRMIRDLGLVQEIPLLRRRAMKAEFGESAVNIGSGK